MKLSKSFEVITNKSRVDSDVAERGFVYEDVSYDSVEELAREILSEGCGEWSSSNPSLGDSFLSLCGDEDIHTGDYTQQSFYPENLTAEQFAKLVELTK